MAPISIGILAISGYCASFSQKALRTQNTFEALRITILAIGILIFILGKIIVLKEDVQMFWALLIAMQAGIVSFL